MNVRLVTDVSSHPTPPATVAAHGARKTTEELVAELQSIVADSPDGGEEILTAMHRLWNCVALGTVQSELFHFKDDQRVPQLLESVQWIFLHQDVWEWPRSGRQRPLAVMARVLNTPGPMLSSLGSLGSTLDN